MLGAKRRSDIVGCVGVLCFALYWVAWLMPQVADALPVSSFGKFFCFSVFLASVPLTIIAAVRGSKWWWVAVATSFITLMDIYIRFARVVR
jgi:ABC-type microcin C transport system permease subunit YejB